MAEYGGIGVYCPKCGTENSDGSKYCKRCGRELPTSKGEQSATEGPAASNVTSPAGPPPSDRHTPPEEFARPAASLREDSARVGDDPVVTGSAYPTQASLDGTAYRDALSPMNPSQQSSQQPHQQTPKRGKAIAIACAAVVVVAAVAAVFAFTVLWGKKEVEEVPEGAVKVEGGSFFSATEKDHVAKDKDTGTSFADNELVVYAAPGTTRKQVEDVMAPYDAVLVGYYPPSNSYQFRFPRSLTLDELRRISNELREHEGIEEVLPNPAPAPKDPENPGEAPTIPEPPHEPEPPHKDQQSDPYLTWGLKAIKAQEAWKALGPPLTSACSTASSTPSTKTSRGCLRT